MTEKQITSGWTGIEGKVGAWGLGSPVIRRLETLLVGDYISTFLSEVSNIIKGDEIVLDVGAGSGYFSLEIAKKLTTGKVTCLDQSEEMLKRLERRAEKKGLEGRIRILKAEASSFKLENKSVDLVVSNFVLHELLNPKAVLLKTYRVLRPGGWIVITDFRKDTMLLDWGKNETHKRGKAGGL